MLVNKREDVKLLADLLLVGKLKLHNQKEDEGGL